MKLSTVAVAATCATLASAKPLDKRALVTTIEWATVTVTVTGTPPTETSAAFFVEPAATTTQVISWSSNSGWSSNSAASSNIAWSSSTDWSSNSNSDGSSGSSGSWPGWAGTGGWRGGWSSGSDSSVPQATYTQVQSETPAATSTLEASSSFATTVETFTTVTAEASSTAEVSSAAAATSTTEATSTTSAAQSVSTSVSSDYQQGILDSHNIHRANASVSNLAWSDDMASIAAQIAASCVYAHDTSTGGGGYGQNIGAGSPPSDIPAMITNLMYNAEINFYPLPYGIEPDMSNFEKWGHYSQIVWKSTTSVGCATQYCPNGLANVGSGVSPYFTVCNYSPPGNFGGEYAANVLQPGGEPTVTL
ncbi:hypothetical protein LTR99_006141 [Exophiala xenobiotica]|uniref:SCP domain-containing protein n=1 Tax=Vermiconidia calcicola TaxID=1690605 RepID=A0AAV9QDG5_9PEZI|nr:hypothetical protein H2202_011051 [Exophiala xenobiotica]KAK5533133.1 hypothetical protein LTR23_009335 [Chaetothyriales sp. CCFEE 6169]KAK5540787.1 hypothetical protein LTR25_002564 [Vermiconidia calcicola]KAK5208347.1 hypothetical protein LTR41_006283 [Exophiala xenobiotica]KAK5223126.1 hypothetical protein LTR72_005963 [Exophiala xenobiotica]